MQCCSGAGAKTVTNRPECARICGHWPQWFFHNMFCNLSIVRCWYGREEALEIFSSLCIDWLLLILLEVKGLMRKAPSPDLSSPMCLLISPPPRHDFCLGMKCAYSFIRIYFMEMVFGYIIHQCKCHTVQKPCVQSDSWVSACALEQPPCQDSAAGWF